MIHWSIMPTEWVASLGQQTYQPHLQECIIEGIQMIVEVFPDGKAQVVRLLSPNPQDYLNPRFQPGSEVVLHPSLGPIL